MAGAFSVIAAVQAHMSHFDGSSDIGRFNAGAAGTVYALHADTRSVLAAALALHQATRGRFDVSLGSGLAPGHLCAAGLLKANACTRIDLGGIAKGFAVDEAVRALVASGCAGGWVNAGGDLRVFGNAETTVYLRDELQGGVRPFLRLAEGAFATSRMLRPLPAEGPAASREADADASILWGGAPRDPGDPAVHLSVAAPECVWADALTKVAAFDDQVGRSLIAAHAAVVWHH